MSGTGVTGILVEDDEILIVKQNVSTKRNWSLPGGHLEEGETLEEGVKREWKEETGIEAQVIKLLYVCDFLEATSPLLHITFLLSKVGGSITLPSNEYDANPISDVKMVPISELEQYGFSTRFTNLALSDFPHAGQYMGVKSNIGL
ncbi:NUDIX domain-containing protein [Gracilibacillus timonensis]|uniref:NUDIX domain-containing protein n=1 Tax=Gracilibacillus timonensis TaxID=1816696 RepID=UPI0008265421|nr:NUDIX hydrolase [Gracilibacillus timonensis]